MPENKETQIKYVHAVQSDLPVILDFEAQYMKEIEPDNFSKWKATKSFQIQQLQESLDRIFIAKSGSKIVGHCFWNFECNQPTIFSIYIKPEWRRKGIASQLLDCVEKDIKANNHNHIHLSTRIQNPAQFLFEKSGYALERQADNWMYFNKKEI